MRTFEISLKIATILAFAAHSLPGFALQVPPLKKSFRVVIDPGHGGNDEGAVYDDGFTRLKEKEITLELARQVAQHLSDRGYSVFLTRDRDEDVPLNARTSLANKLGADVFLSIHLNSTPSRGLGGAEGVETYILNNATDASSRRLAYLENKGLDPTTGADAGTPDVALILKDLRLDGNISDSKRLACAVQSNLLRWTPRRNRGVKQALFYVLLGADMPSALVEAGFLNSHKDRVLLASPKGQRKLSLAITNAIDAFHRAQSTPKLMSSLSKCKVN